jgi:anti-sigma factor RsiW
MTLNPGPDGAPEPELLAAYFDGELEDRADLRRQVEDWLARDPEAQADLEGQRRLRELWQETTPPEPEPQQWQRVLAQVAQARRAAPRRWPAALLAVAACIAVFVGLAAWLLQPGPAPVPIAANKPAEVVEVYPVASADEVVILHVEGDDKQTLVVGEFPLHGPLELAAPGDVERISSEPDARDQMVPDFRLQGPQHPMIWARLDSEEMLR